MTSNVGVFKRYYLNFSGAPITEVLFWDMLFWMESTRSYVENMNGAEDDWDSIKKYTKQIDLQNKNPNHKMKQKAVAVMGAGNESSLSFSNYLVTNFLRDHVIFNKKIAKWPRFLVDPLVKYSLYIEWLFQKYILKDQHNLHKYSNTLASAKYRISKEALDENKTTQKDRSLRTIVERQAIKLKQTQEEKVLSRLTAGP